MEGGAAATSQPGTPVSDHPSAATAPLSSRGGDDIVMASQTPQPMLTVELTDSLALPCFSEAIPVPKNQRRSLAQTRPAKAAGRRVRLSRAASMPDGAMMTSLTSSDYEIFRTGICQSDPGNRPPRRLRRTKSVAFVAEVLVTEHDAITCTRSSSFDRAAPDDRAAGEPQPEADSPPVSPVQEQAGALGQLPARMSTKPLGRNARGELQVESDEDTDDEGVLRLAEAEIMDKVRAAMSSVQRQPQGSASEGAVPTVRREALKSCVKVQSTDSAVFETLEGVEEQDAAWWLSQGR